MTEAPVCQYHSDVVDEVVSIPCQSCPASSGGRYGKGGSGTRSSTSPREIKESPPLPVATVTETVDQHHSDGHKDNRTEEDKKEEGEANVDEGEGEDDEGGGKMGRKEEVERKKVEEEEQEEKLREDTLSVDCPTSSPVGELREQSASLIFSPEGHSDEVMISTQINRQIERVEKFLKTDRLRRPRK